MISKARFGWEFSIKLFRTRDIFKGIKSFLFAGPAKVGGGLGGGGWEG